MAILLISNEEQNPVSMNVTIEGIDYYEIDFKEVGPNPLWNKWYDPSFIASAPIKISAENPIDERSNVTINILLKKQVRQAQPRLCLAEIVDWYWHPLDNSTESPLANEEFFKQYRLWQTDDSNTTEVIPPPKRWNCTYHPDVVIEQPEYLFQLGLAGNKINRWGTYALIDNPVQNGDITTIETIPIAPQIPLIIAGGALFLIILVAMIVAHATDENSPSLKC